MYYKRWELQKRIVCVNVDRLLIFRSGFFQRRSWLALLVDFSRTLLPT
jgi:hypothetical protein